MMIIPQNLCRFQNLGHIIFLRDLLHYILLVRSIMFISGASSRPSYNEQSSFTLYNNVQKTSKTNTSIVGKVIVYWILYNKNWWDDYKWVWGPAYIPSAGAPSQTDISLEHISSLLTISYLIINYDYYFLHYFFLFSTTYIHNISFLFKNLCP